MNVRPGDVLDHYAHMPEQKPELMSRYIVLSAKEDLCTLYVLKGYRLEELVNKQGPVIATQFQKPGDIEELSPKYIVSKDETENNFYWEVIDAI